MSLANISIVGNLVRAPEQIQFTTGRMKTNLLVAVNHPVQQGKENSSADFYQVELWGKLGDLACKYLGKGNQVAVSGRFQLDRWQDRDGKERMTPVVRANQLSLPPRLRVVSTDNSDAANLDDASDSEGVATESMAMVAERAGVYTISEPSFVYVDDASAEQDAFSDADDFPKRRQTAAAL